MTYFTVCPQKAKSMMLINARPEKNQSGTKRNLVAVKAISFPIPRDDNFPSVAVMSLGRAAGLVDF